MQLFAAYAKVKRKTFWVVRYVEITSDVTKFSYLRVYCIIGKKKKIDKIN